MPQFVTDAPATLCMDQGLNTLEHVRIILRYLIIAETETV